MTATMVLYKLTHIRHFKHSNNRVLLAQYIPSSAINKERGGTNYRITDDTKTYSQYLNIAKISFNSSFSNVFISS
ncbi:TPA: hypothetical protein JA346_06360 [Legionella pneumophila]|uniref:Uncharacterized protein n=1 Tax=Legionella pneumophila TaxID=446 RepID=A0A2S6EU47_LEGPN|nr:hypothetical protein C3928_14860 [Legionella pneumophila]RYB41007.1 hypothetical protein D7242_01570 [Legionella pneumophila]RYW29439.1 hypothetical protein D7234_04085 [Legionella pneumophila]TIH01477.1 hypothetical protein DI135_07655 [Legionella pneumophila]HAT6357168.1 hypothetical protein [Legionella pneumophila]